MLDTSKLTTLLAPSLSCSFLDFGKNVHSEAAKRIVQMRSVSGQEDAAILKLLGHTLVNAIGYRAEGSDVLAMTDQAIEDVILVRIGQELLPTFPQRG